MRCSDDTLTSWLRKYLQGWLKAFNGKGVCSLRLIDDVQQITDEIVQHLTRLKNAKVKVVLEIEAEEEEGIPDNVIRTVSENCKTLKFKSQSFEAK